MTDNALIGGEISQGQVAATLIDPEDRSLGEAQLDELWEIFQAIGKFWENLSADSSEVKSSWREFMVAKTESPPSYIGEYLNALAVTQELKAMYGEEEAYTLLFIRNGIPEGPPTTRLAHAKRYVVDEFIRMQVVASGFKGFAKPTSFNYQGYVGGSRYNRLPRVRSYPPRDNEVKTSDALIARESEE